MKIILTNNEDKLYLIEDSVKCLWFCIITILYVVYINNGEVSTARRLMSLLVDEKRGRKKTRKSYQEERIQVPVKRR